MDHFAQRSSHRLLYNPHPIPECHPMPNKNGRTTLSTGNVDMANRFLHVRHTPPNPLNDVFPEECTHAYVNT